MNPTHPEPDQGTTDGSVVGRFIATWHLHLTVTDIAAFVRGCAATPDDCVAVLLADRRYRLRDGLPVPVAEYRRHFPEAFAHPAFTAWLHDQTADYSGPNGYTTTRPGGAPAEDDLVTRTSDGRAAPSGDDEPIPTALGRYRVLSVLGSGAFGRVLLARDEELDRPVAVKVPHRYLVRRPEDVATYLAEARTLAMLDHPAIVPVHDVGRTEDGLCFVVSKYVEGRSLATLLERGRITAGAAAELVARLADALDHAHHRGLVHRDVKPANVLLDRENAAYLADFGLALRVEESVRTPGLVGTPAYMSPEQARGEGHRVDARSDVFSLGVVFYELLAGRRPFNAETRSALLAEIISADPPSPRHLDPTVPQELEWICLKAMAKRGVDRYATARDLADDLRGWIDRPTRSSHPELPALPAGGGPPATVVPKGLRSFEAQDAYFFLSLLPGPFARDGLPESVRFWKSRVESPEAAAAVPVGLVYGPSGCGKSSLVKAGLLPRLAERVRVLYLEATANDTEDRLLAGVRKAWPGVPAAAGLADAVAAVRRAAEATGEKLLIVLDQFEQWLHAHPADPGNTELVRAIRHCDGVRVQCLVTVRDDFWLGVTRFLRELEVRLVEGQNSALVDLFDPRHARQVLADFGRAWGCLPAGELTADQERFLDQAVGGLTTDGKVVPVRLALFAEMVKAKAWTPAALRAVGGAEGVGVNFLEETFAAPTAPPAHRSHLAAVRGVLRALLPDPGADIKGQMRSRADLQTAAGYDSKPAEFDDLLYILDQELKLVTPTEAPDPTGTPPGAAYYQLTHDYLVPAVRQWLTRKQRETLRGRAELRLAERAALWKTKPDARYLPSGAEWLLLLAVTGRQDRSDAEQRMMRAATRHHGIRLVLTAAAIATLGLAAWVFAAAYQDGLRRDQAAALVQKLSVVNTEQAPAVIDELEPLRGWAVPQLTEIVADETRSPKARLHARLALLPDDPTHAGELAARLLTAEADEFLVVRRRLEPHRDRVVDPLAERLTVTEGGAAAGERFRAAAALAALAPDRPNWAELAGPLIDHLVASNPVFLKGWMTAFAPVKDHLRPALLALARDDRRGPDDRSVAVSVLADYYHDDPAFLIELLLAADPAQFNSILPRLVDHAAKAVPLLTAEAGRTAGPDWADRTESEAPPADLVARLRAAGGALTDRIGYCVQLPVAEAVAAAERLRALGYRPVNFRPYRAGGEVLAAAVWRRDRADWRLTAGATAAALKAQDEAYRKDGLAPADVAVYLPPGETEPVYTAVWATADRVPPRAVLRVGLTDEAVKQMTGDTDGLFPLVVSGCDRGGGVRVFAGVWASSTDGKGRSAQRGNARWLSGLPWGSGVVSDVRVEPRVVQGTLTRDRDAKLAAAEADLKPKPNDPTARVRRAEALYHLGRYADAVADLNAALDREPKRADARRLRVLAEARGGNPAVAKRELVLYGLQEPNEAEEEYLYAIVHACSGEDEDAMKRLDYLASTKGTDAAFQVRAAGAFAVAAGVVKDKSRAERYTRKAVELLRKGTALDAGAADAAVAGSDFEAVRDHPEFKALVDRPDSRLEFAAAWGPETAGEEQVVVALPADQHETRARGLLADGFRPRTVAAGWGGDGRPAEVVSAWHRPVATPAEADRAAVRRANAALALARLTAPDAVWPLLRYAPDPRVRTELVHRLGPQGRDPAPVAARLADPDPGVRQAAVLALGEFPSELLPSSRRAALVDRLLAAYRTDPDAGVHGAAEWLLRRWGQMARAVEADDRPDPPAGARWGKGPNGHTLSAMPGPVTFRMGSPAGEPGRGLDEMVVEVTLPRGFAVGTKEVTRGQLAKFRTAFRARFDGNKSAAVERMFQALGGRAAEKFDPAEADLPAAPVTYLEAIAYCRWLSEQAGVPEDQMCYPPLEQIGNTERAIQEQPGRTGFRLPITAEWECAARGGTTTARYYGQSDEHLPKYAWFAYNSRLLNSPRRAADVRDVIRQWHDGKAQVWPVGQLAPNPLGLFDALGNAAEWCHDTRGVETAEAPEMRGMALSGWESRAVRGGTYLDTPDAIRAAARSRQGIGYAFASVGFRVARTLPAETK